MQKAILEQIGKKPRLSVELLRQALDPNSRLKFTCVPA